MGKQNKEGFESKEAPDDLAKGVKNATYEYGPGDEKGAEEVGGTIDPPFKPAGGGS